MTHSCFINAATIHIQMYEHSIQILNQLKGNFHLVRKKISQSSENRFPQFSETESPLENLESWDYVGKETNLAELPELPRLSYEKRCDNKFQLSIGAFH